MSENLSQVLEAASTTVPDSIDPNLSKADLLEALDYEINTIEKARATPGWTNWTFIGAIAALIWTFANELFQKQFSIVNALLIFLLLSCFLDFATLLVRCLKPDLAASKGSRTRIRLSAEILGASRITNVCFGVRSALVLTAYWQVHKAGFTSYALAVTYISSLLLAMVGFALGSFKFPLPDVLNKTWYQTILKFGVNLIIVAVPSVALYDFLDQISRTFIPITSVECRLGMICSVTIWLICKWASHIIEEQPVLLVLKKIRSDLSFGKIDTKEAIRQSEIALDGMLVDDYFQKDMLAILTHYEMALREIEEMKECSRLASELVEAAERGGGKRLSERLIADLEVLLKTREKHRAVVDSALDVRNPAYQIYIKKKALLRFVIEPAEQKRIEAKSKFQLDKIKDEAKNNDLAEANLKKAWLRLHQAVILNNSLTANQGPEGGKVAIDIVPRDPSTG